jgi:hypothetical protein
MIQMIAETMAVQASVGHMLVGADSFRVVFGDEFQSDDSVR